MGPNGLPRPVRWASALFVALLATPALAQVPVIPAPSGFRPYSPQATSFVEALDDAKLLVLPTIVRGSDWITHSVASQRSIVEFCAESGLVEAISSNLRIDIGVPPQQFQWKLFQNALVAIDAALEDWPFDADYALMMEILFQPGDRIVFGVQTYVLDRQGRNVFSFLLNAHHEIFAAAALVVADGTEEARAATVAEATRVGVTALEAQVKHARECAAWMAANPPQPMEAGVFEDFDKGLTAIQDPHGIPLGFSTFTDGESRVSIDTTSVYPPRPGEGPGNTALRVDVEVAGWVGFVELPYDASNRMWRAQDWSAFDGLSFWMYGKKTGTQLFVDVLDNRNPCSTVDDAERYVYEFVDDFSGWREVFIPFRDMVRKEIWNGAPDDGLGLCRVHGWAFGATGTGDPTTWYLDDVTLWADGSGDP
jgi:hypothetical protein